MLLRLLGFLLLDDVFVLDAELLGREAGDAPLFVLLGGREVRQRLVRHREYRQIPLVALRKQLLQRLYNFLALVRCEAVVVLRLHVQRELRLSRVNGLGDTAQVVDL